MNKYAFKMDVNDEDEFYYDHISMESAAAEFAAFVCQSNAQYNDFEFVGREMPGDDWIKLCVTIESVPYYGISKVEDE